MLKFDEEGIRTRINDVLIGSMDETPLVDDKFGITSNVEKDSLSESPIFVYDIHEENSKWRYRVSILASLFIRLEVLLNNETEIKSLFAMSYLYHRKDKYFLFSGIHKLVKDNPTVSSYYPNYKNDKDIIDYVNSAEKLLTQEIKNLYNTNREIVKDESKLGYYYITEQAKLALKVFNGVISLYEDTR